MPPVLFAWLLARQCFLHIKCRSREGKPCRLLLQQCNYPAAILTCKHAIQILELNGRACPIINYRCDSSTVNAFCNRFYLFGVVTYLLHWINSAARQSSRKAASIKPCHLPLFARLLVPRLEICEEKWILSAE